MHIFITTLLAAVSTTAERIRLNPAFYGTPQSTVVFTFWFSEPMLGDEGWWVIDDVYVDPSQGFMTLLEDLEYQKREMDLEFATNGHSERYDGLEARWCDLKGMIAKMRPGVDFNLDDEPENMSYEDPTPYDAWGVPSDNTSLDFTDHYPDGI